MTGQAAETLLVDEHSSTIRFSCAFHCYGYTGESISRRIRIHLIVGRVKSIRHLLARYSSRSALKV